MLGEGEKVERRMGGSDVWEEMIGIDGRRKKMGFWGVIVNWRK